MGNQNHPYPWVLDHEAKPRGWRTARRSLTPILTGSNSGVGENETRSAMCDRRKGKGQRQDSGGTTIAGITSVNILMPVQEKKRGVKQRYLPFLPCCLPGPAQAGYPRALGCIRALVTGSPLQSADPSPLPSGILSIPPLTPGRTLLPIFLLSLTVVQIGFVSLCCPHSRAPSLSLWIHVVRSCFSLPPSVHSISFFPLEKKRNGGQLVLHFWDSQALLDLKAIPILFHSHSCPSPMNCPFYPPDSPTLISGRYMGFGLRRNYQGCTENPFLGKDGHAWHFPSITAQ